MFQLLSLSLIVVIKMPEYSVLDTSVNTKYTRTYCAFEFSVIVV